MNKKRVGIVIDSELYKQAKIQALNLDETVTQYITNLIKKDLETKKDIRC
ncbi:MAG: type II toxin-antitoxin system CcdA family antitoxin [Longibaculum sp.]